MHLPLINTHVLNGLRRSTSTTGEVLLRMADLDDSVADRFATDIMTVWKNVDIAFDIWSAMIGQTISHGRRNGDMIAKAHKRGAPAAH